jgi:hypothetical protein
LIVYPALDYSFMRRTELVRKIQREARRQGVTWEPAGTSGPHECFWLGASKIPIPRHREISERTAEDILHECQDQLGEGWWRQ